MRKVFLIFCIFVTLVSFVIPAYSQLDKSCVSDYLDQIVSIAATDDVSALVEILSLVQYAQLRCLADGDIPMLKSDGTVQRIEDINCSVRLELSKSRERGFFEVFLGFSDGSRDDFFFDFWRDGVKLEEPSGSYDDTGNNSWIYYADLNSLNQGARGTYIVVYEDMVTQVAYSVGFEVKRPGKYRIIFGCSE